MLFARPDKKINNLGANIAPAPKRQEREPIINETGWIVSLREELPDVNTEAYTSMTDEFDEIDEIIDVALSSGDEMMPLIMPVYAPIVEQQQMLTLFTASIAPPGQYLLHKVFRNHAGWLAHLPSLAGTHLLLDTAVRAVSLTHLGKIHHNEEMIEQSRGYYGKALRLLGDAIQDEKTGLASETLSSTILLSFYEMFASSERASWIRHAGGAATLMKMRGPARHRYGFDRAMFIAYRNAIVIQAFEVEQACFLDEPEWRKVAQQIFEDLKAEEVPGNRLEIFQLIEDFFNEMIQLPGFVRDAQKIPAKVKARGGDVKAAISRLAERASRFRNRLKSVFVNFAKALADINAAPTMKLVDDPLFSTEYEFANLATGSYYCGHWTVLIILNFVLIQLHRDKEQQALYKQESLEHARNCCKSYRYMATSSFLGPFFVAFGLRMALLVMQGLPEEKWIINKLMDLGMNKLGMAAEMAKVHMEQTIPGKVQEAYSQGYEELTEEDRGRL